MHSNPQTLLRTALLITTAVVLFPTVAKAAPLTYNTGDLLMGFRAGNASDTKDFVINIGAYSNFTSPQAKAPLSVGSIGADLTAVFGPSWFNRPDLFWSVVGFENTTKTNTLYATKAQIALGVDPGAPTTINSNTTQALASGVFTQAGQAYSSSNTGDSTTGSGGAATNTKGLRQLTSDTGSWSSFNGGTNAFTGNNWNYFAIGTEANFGSGSANSVLDLYQVIRNGLPTAPPNGGAINNIGYFTIDNTGVVSYGGPGPLPVPEPASLFLLASSAAVFGFGRRRARR